MSVLYTEGFDWWASADTVYFFDRHNTNWTVTTGRMRNNCPTNCQQGANYNSDVQYEVVQFLDPENGWTNEVIVGYCLNMYRISGQEFGCVLCAPNIAAQASWQSHTDGSIRLYRGNKNVLLWESDPGVVFPNVYNHFEVRVRCDNTSGEFELRLNGEQLVNLTGIDTQNQAGTSQLSELVLGFSASNWHYYEDVYVLDLSGGVNDDFLGPAPYVNTIFPSATGTHAEWMPSAGNNWDCVDDYHDVNTADYIMVSGDYLVDGAQDCYTYEDVESWDDDIYSVTFNQIGRDWTTSGEALALMKLGAAEFTNSGENVLRPWRTDYGYTNRWKYVWNKNPSGEITWTTTHIDDAEFGVEWKA